MPEFKKPEPPKSPEPKTLVSADEFIKAVKGNSFIGNDALLRLRGNEIDQTKLFPDTYFNLEDEKEYVILKEAKIKNADVLELLNTAVTDYKIGFIFYKSILPSIIMQNTIIGDWYLFNSFIKGFTSFNKNSKCGNMVINSNSQSGDIFISSNSQCGDIFISSNSQCGKTFISSNSQCGDISLSENSLCGVIIIMKNSQYGDIIIIKNSQCGDIIISENSQCGYINLRENSQCGYINIYTNCRCQDISSFTNSLCGYISIRENCQSGYISISENSQCGDISISENCQTGFIGITKNSQCGDISISENCQTGFINVRENSQCGYIDIRKICQTGDIYFNNSTCPSLTISGNYLSLQLFNAIIPLMKLNNCFVASLTWQAGTKGELYISNSKINHLDLQDSSLLKDALISVTNSKLFIAQMNKLAIQGQLLLTNLIHLEKPFDWEPALKKQLAAEKPGDDASEFIKSIYKSKIKHLTGQEVDYNEEKEILLKEVSDKPLWRMANSSLGKTEITGSNLTGFVFEYRDSKLLDTFISGTQLPKNKIDIYNPDAGNKLDNTDYFEQKISIYSQLKKIFENQGNIVEATWYHSKAMDNQQRLLQLNYRRQKKKWFSEEGFDLLNFKLNKFSNNHGESWRKALRFVLISSFIIYSLYYISINYHKEFSFTGWGDFIGRFFSFLNFTRREDFMVGKEELNVLSYFFDYLGRVVTGFGIYQLIAAFRRHGRR